MSCMIMSTGWIASVMGMDLAELEELAQAESTRQSLRAFMRGARMLAQVLCVLGIAGMQ